MKRFFSNRIVLFVVLTVVSLAAVGAFAVVYKTRGTAGTENVSNISFSESTDSNKSTEILNAPIDIQADKTLNKAVLKVEGLTCSSCVKNIKTALMPVKGVKKVLVDVANGNAEIYFDSTKLKKANKIASAISDNAGYTASLVNVVDNAGLQSEASLNEKLRQLYIAAINDREITRADFDTEVAALRKGYTDRYGEDIFNTPQGIGLEERLTVQVMTNLIDQEMILGDIAKANFTLTEKRYDDELNKLLEEKSLTFEDAVKNSGFEEGYFEKKLQNNILISTYLEEKILINASNPSEKGQLFNQWFANTKSLAQVVYYDDAIKETMLAQSASGCGKGAGCCP